MKSHLHSSRNSHAAWVRPQGNAILPECHSVAPLKDQINTKSSKKKNKKINIKNIADRIV